MSERIDTSETTMSAVDVNEYETDERGFPLTDQFGRELDPLFYTKVNAKIAREYRIDVGARFAGGVLPIAEVGGGEL